MLNINAKKMRKKCEKMKKKYSKHNPKYSIFGFLKIDNLI